MYSKYTLYGIQQQPKLNERPSTAHVFFSPGSAHTLKPRLIAGPMCI